MRWLDPAYWNHLRQDYPERFAACCGVAVAALGLAGYGSVSVLGGGSAATGDYGIIGRHPAPTQPAAAQPHSTSLFASRFGVAATTWSRVLANPLQTSSAQGAFADS